MPRRQPEPLPEQLDGWRLRDIEGGNLTAARDQDWRAALLDIGVEDDDPRVSNLLIRIERAFAETQDDWDISKLQPSRATQRRELLQLIKDAEAGRLPELAYETECMLANELLTMRRTPVHSDLAYDPHAYSLDDQVEAARRLEVWLAQPGGQRKNMTHRLIVERLADIYRNVTGKEATHFTGKHTSKVKNVRAPQSAAGQFIVKCVRAAQFPMTEEQVSSVLEAYVRDRKKEMKRST